MNTRTAQTATIEDTQSFLRELLADARKAGDQVQAKRILLALDGITNTIHPEA